MRTALPNQAPPTKSHRPRAVTVFAAAFVAGAAAAVGVNRALDVRLAQAKPRVESEAIFVALRSLPQGATVTVWDVALRDWPKAMMPVSALRSHDTFSGRILKHPLREGQPLLSIQLLPSGQANQPGAEASPATPPADYTRGATPVVPATDADLWAPAEPIKVAAIPPARPPVAAPQPPLAQSPVTQPPVTQPPVTQPPVTQPHVTQPTVTQPPVAQSPVTQPPVSQPAVSQPPAAPSVPQPPATPEPAPQVLATAVRPEPVGPAETVPPAEPVARAETAAPADDVAMPPTEHERKTASAETAGDADSNTTISARPTEEAIASAAPDLAAEVEDNAERNDQSPPEQPEPAPPAESSVMAEADPAPIAAEPLKPAAQPTAATRPQHGRYLVVPESIALKADTSFVRRADAQPREDEQAPRANNAPAAVEAVRPLPPTTAANEIRGPQSGRPSANAPQGRSPQRQGRQSPPVDAPGNNGRPTGSQPSRQPRFGTTMFPNLSAGASTIEGRLRRDQTERHQPPGAAKPVTAR